MNIYTVFVSDPDNAVTLLKAFSSENRAREYLRYAARLKYNELQILQRQGQGEENYGGTITNLQLDEDDDGEDTKDSIFISYTSNYIDWWGKPNQKTIIYRYRIQSVEYDVGPLSFPRAFVDADIYMQ